MTTAYERARRPHEPLRASDQHRKEWRGSTNFLTLHYDNRAEGLEQLMPAKHLKAFLQQPKQDEILQTKLKTSANQETTVTVAKEKEAEFSLSANDLSKTQAELEDEGFDEASGGRGFAERFAGIFQTHHDGGILDRH